jgi:hypothetical protein
MQISEMSRHLTKAPLLVITIHTHTHTYADIRNVSSSHKGIFACQIRVNISGRVAHAGQQGTGHQDTYSCAPYRRGMYHFVCECVRVLLHVNILHTRFYSAYRTKPHSQGRHSEMTYIIPCVCVCVAACACIIETKPQGTWHQGTYSCVPFRHGMYHCVCVCVCVCVLLHVHTLHTRFHSVHRTKPHAQGRHSEMAYIIAYLCVYVFVLLHVHILLKKNKRANTHKHTRTHICMYTHTHTYIHTQTYYRVVWVDRSL